MKEPKDIFFDKGWEAEQAKNYENAAEWYAKAAELGSLDAQKLLGFMYRTGTGVKKNYPEAVKWYRLAADQGDSQSQLDLGTLFYYGSGVDKDLTAAKFYLSLAAENGEYDAKELLARLDANSIKC